MLWWSWSSWSSSSRLWSRSRWSSSLRYPSAPLPLYCLRLLHTWNMKPPLPRCANHHHHIHHHHTQAWSPSQAAIFEELTVHSQVCFIVSYIENIYGPNRHQNLIIDNYECLVPHKHHHHHLRHHHVNPPPQVCFQFQNIHEANAPVFNFRFTCEVRLRICFHCFLTYSLWEWWLVTAKLWEWWLLRSNGFWGVIASEEWWLERVMACESDGFWKWWLVSCESDGLWGVIALRVMALRVMAFESDGFCKWWPMTCESDDLWEWWQWWWCKECNK